MIEYEVLYDDYTILEIFPYEWEAVAECDHLNVNNLDMNIEYVVVEVTNYTEWSELEGGWFLLE